MSSGPRCQFRYVRFALGCTGLASAAHAAEHGQPRPEHGEDEFALPDVFMSGAFVAVEDISLDQDDRAAKEPLLITWGVSGKELKSQSLSRVQANGYMGRLVSGWRLRSLDHRSFAVSHKKWGISARFGRAVRGYLVDAFAARFPGEFRATRRIGIANKNKQYLQQENTSTTCTQYSDSPFV